MFATEPFSMELLQEMLPLWQRHHDETAMYKEFPLNPDIEMYAKSSEIGLLKIYTVRNSGKLIGYQVFFVMRHPHSRDLLQATQDIIFIDREHRRGLNGYKFLKYCSDDLIKNGVQAVFQHISADHDFGAILRRMGYKICDLVYGKTACQPQH
jgi:hypothetical protein